MHHRRWNLLPPAPDNHLANTSDFPRLIAQLLYSRGVTDPSQLELFIAADERLSGNPFLLPDIHQATARVYQALLSGENIAIYGDFDADGITGTALLIKGLTALGGKPIPYIPHRLNEGHGVRKTVLENLHRQGISLVITVDCGITALSQVKKAKKLGLDVIITDHHTPLEEIPPAIAVVNPKLPSSNYPYSELAGVGVAFKFLQALFQGIGKEKQLDELVDLVALGTVADMVPLVGENRYLVKQGLKLINTNPRLGLREMITRAGLNIGQLNAENISWIIAPRLNAAGRMEHAMSGYKLLMTDSPQEAQELSAWLEQKNTERQKLTTKVFTKAREQVLAQGISPLLIASDKDYFISVAGLVAGRLSNEFYRPAIVIKTGEQMSWGSCRSIPEFNIVSALNKCSHWLAQFGGHSRAAGFTLPTKNLGSFQQHLCQIAASQLAGVDLRPHLDIDAEVSLPELGGNTFQTIHQLAPFGVGNLPPTFLSLRVEAIDCRTMGNGSEHLRLKLKQNGTVWDGVGFGLGNYLAEASSPLDIVYNLEVDHWGGGERLRLNILDFAPSR